MRRTLKLAMTILIVALLALPALAAFRVLSDTFDPESGTGVAIVQVSDILYAEILYRDLDGTQTFTSRDQRLKVHYFRRGDGKPPGRSLDRVQLDRG